MRLHLVSFLMLALGVSTINLQAQLPYTFVDMNVQSTRKAFHSQNEGQEMRYSIWEKIEHSCPSTIDKRIQEVYKDIPFYSQAHLAALIEGNVRISNQIIYPLEGQFFRSQFFTRENGIDVIACLTGIQYSRAELLSQNYDYFQQIVRQIRYIKEEQKYNYHLNGRAYNFQVLSSPKDIQAVEKDPTKLGLTLSLRGGHVLGSFLYIDQDLYRTEEFKNKVLNNVRRLKGELPLVDNTEEYLEYPILSINFSNWYQDGICGKLDQFDAVQSKVFGKPKSLNQGFSPIGKEVINTLIQAGTGRRILVDVGGMTLAARKWYYQMLHDKRYHRDTIPILATNVAITRLGWEDENFVAEIHKGMQEGHLFNNSHQSLAREDIQNIYASNGLIGLSLSKDRLLGTDFLERYNATATNSAERRQRAIEAIAGNICQIIYTLQERDAWQIISISSGFDETMRPFEFYKEAGDMYRLANDLKAFFEAPKDIKGLFTASEIKQLMYDYSADEIVEMLMAKNAKSFLKRNLKATQKNAQQTVDRN